MDTISTENLSAFVNNATTYAILTHKRPDGDAISSALAMFWYLIDIGKEPDNIDIIIPEFIEDFSFIDGINYLKTTPTKEEYDVIIVVDCADIHLLEGCFILSRSQKIICLDHHEKTSMPYTHCVIDPLAPSCSYIIYNTFLCKNKYFLNCIATGLISDTSNLSLNVTDLVRNTIKQLDSLGVDINHILLELTSQSPRTLELAYLIQKRGYFKGNPNNLVFCSYLLQDDLLDSEKNLNTVNHKAIISELQRSTNYTSLVLLLENDKGEFKGSLRTCNSNIDLNNICSNLVSAGKLVKGGGHNSSSGCTAIGSYHDILEFIANEILNS